MTFVVELKALSVVDGCDDDDVNDGVTDGVDGDVGALSSVEGVIDVVVSSKVSLELDFDS